jgi:DHA1 family bicyclomycin/chloramphenicol resistance-like MFS transporter
MKPENSMKSPAPRRWHLIPLLGALTALCPFSIDMYLPAFLRIASDFQVPAARVTLSLSGFFIGMAAGQLFYGPLLDRFGRKRPLYAALAIYGTASIGCSLSRSMNALIVLRFIQAVGGCGVDVAAIAFVRDYFTGKEAAKVFSSLLLILAVSPLFAPSIGGILVLFMGWRSIFLVLAGISLALGLMAYFYIPPGNPPDLSRSLRPRPIVQAYLGIWKTPGFSTYALAGSFALFGLFMYVSSSPIIFLQIFKVAPKTYGWLFSLMAIGFVGSSQLNHLLLQRFTSQQILRTGLLGMTLVALGFLIGTWTGHCGLAGTIGSMFFYLAFFGISNPNAAALALSPFSKNAGSASALLGFLQLGIGAVSSVGISFLKTPVLFPLAGMFSASSFLALLMVLTGRQALEPSHLEPSALEIPPAI